MMASLWMNVWILSLRLLQVLRGGKNRVEMRVSTNGGCRPHPGQGRIRAREERGRSAGGGAWPPGAALTRWHSDRWRESGPPLPLPRLSGKTCPRDLAQVPFLCPAHALAPPLPQQSSPITLQSTTGPLSQLNPEMPAWSLLD